jgi:Na+-transporting NADH:ubiquinone oxidoreductase subunit NqrF
MNESNNKEIYRTMLFLYRSQGFAVNEDDKKAFLDDFKKGNVDKKLDMWYYAVEQEAFWEEILAEMSMIAQAANPQKGKVMDDE